MTNYLHCYKHSLLNRFLLHVNGCLYCSINPIQRRTENGWKQNSANFFCGYENLALWLEEYEEDPLEGLDLRAPVAKKLKRHREYILANRKTTLEERMVRRMGGYLKSDPMPEKKIAELSQVEYRELLHRLVNQELFVVQGCVRLLLKESSIYEKLSDTFREFFVAYELLELVLEAYHYDPDEGLELRPEVAERLDRSVAEVEAGTAQLIPLEEAAKTFGIKLKCTH